MGAALSLLLGIVGFAGVAIFLRGRLKKSDEPAALVFKWIVTVGCFLLWVYLGIQAQGAGVGGAFLIPGIAAATGIILAILWTPHISDLITSPLTSWYDGGDEEPELRPLYSMAQAQRMRGDYRRAVAEIHKQLAQFPEDFQGWMMLAEVQGEDLGNLDEAMNSIDHLLTLPGISAKNAAYALGRVADWELDPRGDREAAKRALERFREMFPETPEAQVVAQRIAHLASDEHLANLRDPRVIALKHIEEKVGLRGELFRPAPPEDAAATAQGLVDHLRDFPLDNEAREKLALLYANEYKRLDLAAAELEQLIATPHQLPKNVVHWLNLLADLQIRLGAGVEAARATLRRIVEMDPKSAAANTANVRMSQLRLELNQLAEQRTIKLGQYDQNIGLNGRNRPGGRGTEG